MDRQLVLKNPSGQILRVFQYGGEKATILSRADTGRLEIHENPQRLSEKKIPFISLGNIQAGSITLSNLFSPDWGQFDFVEKVESTQNDVKTPEDSEKSWWYALAWVLILVCLGVFILHSLPEAPPPEKEEKKVTEHRVRIPKPQSQATPLVKIPRRARISQKSPISSQKKARSMKRLGALAVLGQLNKKQKGGLDLGAVKTTAGPGLGGTQGSGGAQTSLYGKGIIQAPVGAGANLKGAGGYGTKGKGGGQAGYGEMTLVGATGAGLLPLANEAVIQGGLDRDLIAAVIRKNMGQIRFCYEQGLQSNRHLAGRVAVNFTINGQGAVKTANLANTTLHSQVVESCILRRLRTWKFPSPEGGVNVNVAYPFLLRRVGRG